MLYIFNLYLITDAKIKYLWEIEYFWEIPYNPSWNISLSLLCWQEIFGILCSIMLHHFIFASQKLYHAIFFRLLCGTNSKLFLIPQIFHLNGHLLWTKIPTPAKITANLPEIMHSQELFIGYRRSLQFSQYHFPIHYWYKNTLLVQLYLYSSILTLWGIWKHPIKGGNMNRGGWHKYSAVPIQSAVV